MKPKAYLETTIVSYLTARPSRDLIAAVNQQMTHDWWEDHRGQFALYVSQFVIEEASAGDPDAATRRLAVLADLHHWTSPTPSNSWHMPCLRTFHSPPMRR